jgi:hypothetical protein
VFPGDFVQESGAGGEVDEPQVKANFGRWA